MTWQFVALVVSTLMNVVALIVLVYARRANREATIRLRDLHAFVDWNAFSRFRR